MLGKRGDLGGVSVRHLRKVVPSLPLAFSSDVVELFFELIVVLHKVPMVSDQALTFFHEQLHGLQNFLLSVPPHDAPQRTSRLASITMIPPGGGKSS